MPLSKLQFRPGVVRDITSYSNEGGWYDIDNVRFQKGFPEKIGGWQKKSNQSFLGTCRSLHPWVTLSRDQLLGVGTHLKFYVDEGGAFNDITPLRSTTTAGDVTFSATNGSSELTVTDTNHGAVQNDFVTFSGATSLGGNITADVLNQEYQITSVTDANTYTITARSAGTSISDITEDGQLNPTEVDANSSDTSDGGSAVVGKYQVNTGLDLNVSGAGWGAGTWSRAGWGEASDDAIVSNTLRMWSQDNFGEDLLINVRDGGIYYWDATNGLTNRAVNITDLAGSTSAPQVAKQIMVSDRDRHVIAFGCDPEGDPGNQDPLTIRFSDQETLTEWNATATNTAGELRLGSGSEIVAAVEARQQIVVFTDTTLYVMQFLGAPFTFGVSSISENITIAGPKSAVAVGDAVYWMGVSEFYVYDGAMRQLPCTVRDYIFDNMNPDQQAKVVAGLNAEHSEVWWFYPRGTSDQLDHYVVYNYAEQSWYYGSFARTAWIDRGIFAFPIAAHTDGYLYAQETGFDDGTTNPASAITAFVRSSPMDLGDGEQFLLIRRMIPDVSFKQSTAALPSIDIEINVRNASSGEYIQTDTQTFVDTRTASSSEKTEQLYYRLRGRQMRIKFTSNDLGVDWRLGSNRVDMKPDGRR